MCLSGGLTVDSNSSYSYESNATKFNSLISNTEDKRALFICENKISTEIGNRKSNRFYKNFRNLEYEYEYEYLSIFYPSMSTSTSTNMSTVTR